MANFKDFQLSDEQLSLKQQAITYAETELNDDLLQQDYESQFSRDKWNKCAEFGIQGLCFPDDYVGLGRNSPTTILILEGLCYGCEDNGLLSALNGQMWVVQQLFLTFGSAAQKQKYLPGLCHGELIGAHGMTESDSGSDAFSLQTRAERRDGGYVINGSKLMISLAPVCDVAVVFAITDPSLGQWGISAFLVEKGMAGFHVSKALEKMGLRTVPLGELILENCFVPEANRLGPEGAGTSIFASTMEWERGFNFSGHVGAMERQLEKVIADVKQSKQFDPSVETTQPISRRIADMKLRLETSRLHL